MLEVYDLEGATQVNTTRAPSDPTFYQILDVAQTIMYFWDAR
jgi:hypothetical protein